MAAYTEYQLFCLSQLGIHPYQSRCEPLTAVQDKAHLRGANESVVEHPSLTDLRLALEMCLAEETASRGNSCDFSVDPSLTRPLWRQQRLLLPPPPWSPAQKRQLRQLLWPPESC